MQRRSHAAQVLKEVAGLLPEKPKPVQKSSGLQVRVADKNLHHQQPAPDGPVGPGQRVHRKLQDQGRDW